MTRRFSSILFAVPLALGLAACATDADTSDDSYAAAQLLDAAVAPTDGGAPASDAATPSAPFTLTSRVVKDGEYIDAKYRCNVPSPMLSWTAGPAGTQSYALVLQDQGNGFYHWTIFDIPATERGLPENVPVREVLDTPKGAKQAPNWSRRQGYGGPCGGDSTYVFTLYALDVAALPGVTPSSTPANIVRAIEAHDLASTKLTIRSKAAPR